MSMPSPSMGVLMFLLGASVVLFSTALIVSDGGVGVACVLWIVMSLWAIGEEHRGWRAAGVRDPARST